MSSRQSLISNLMPPISFVPAISNGESTVCRFSGDTLVSRVINVNSVLTYGQGRLRSCPPRISLIINSRARANYRHPNRMGVLAEALGKSDRVAVTRSIKELERTSAELAADRPEIIAICGGDGTLHQTLTALIHSYGDRPLPAVAILPGGAMNIVATSLGIRGDPVDHLRALVELKRRCGLESVRTEEPGEPSTAGQLVEVFEHPLLQIEERYGFMFGTGVIHDFLEAYYATGQPSRMTAARLLLRAAASTLVGGSFSRRLCQPLHASVEADGQGLARPSFHRDLRGDHRTDRAWVQAVLPLLRGSGQVRSSRDPYAGSRAAS